MATVFIHLSLVNTKLVPLLGPAAWGTATAHHPDSVTSPSSSFIHSFIQHTSSTLIKDVVYYKYRDLFILFGAAYGVLWGEVQVSGRDTGHERV